MSILRRLFSMFASSGGTASRGRGRSSGGGLMSMISKFTGGSRGRRSTRI